jgi:Flp pilus assembly protein TadD
MATRQGYPLREPMVYGFYGQALTDSGEHEAAVAAFDRALTFDNPPPKIHNQLGQVLMRLDRYPEAEAHLRTASEQSPSSPNGPYNLGVLRMYQGNPADAVTWFREALRRDPDQLRAVLGLAQALHESGYPDEAKKQFAIALRMSRDWPAAAIEQGWRMATHPDPKARYAAESLRLARLLVAAGGGKTPSVLNLWAAALAESGRFEEAERTARSAAETARTLGNAAFAADAEARRVLYASKKPYRQPIDPH